MVGERNGVETNKKGFLVGRIIGKFLRFCIYTILAIIGLNAILYIVLSIPPVQQRLVDFTVDQLKSKLKTEASIGEIRLSFFDHLKIKDLYVEDLSKDTLVYANHLEVKLSPWELLRSKTVSVTSIRLNDFLINVNKKDSLSDYNFQFIVDAFASSDSTKKDDSGMNLLVKIGDVNIHHGRLNYDILSDSITPNEFNASHISLRDFNTNIDVRSIDIDNLDVSLNSLSVKEGSGVEIVGLSGRVYSSGSQMWVDNLVLELPNSHLVTDKAQFDIESMKFALGTQNTEVDGRDLIAFLPGLKHLSHKLSLKLDAEGKLPLIDLKQLTLNYGEEAVLEGRAFIENYERYADSELFVSIDQFRMTPVALTEFVRLGDSTFVRPTILDTVGNIHFKGRIDGRISDFKFDSELWTRQGVVSLTADGGADSIFSNMHLQARMETVDFNLADILGQDSKLGKFSTRMALKASMTEKNGLDAELKGALDELEIGKDSLRNLYFMAQYDAKQMGAKIYRESKSGVIFLSASKTHAKQSEVNVKLNLDEFKIGRIFPNENWIDPKITVRLDGYVKDLNIDNMVGRLTIDSLDFKGDNFRFAPGLIRLDITQQEDKKKDITLASSILTANINGDYSFSTLPFEFSNIMHKCLPSVFAEEKQFRHNHNDFTFKLTAYSTESYGNIFGLPLDIVEPLTISGRVNTIEEKLFLRGDIPQLRYKEIDINNTKLGLANLDSTFYIDIKTSALTKVNNYNFDFYTHGGTDQMHNKLKLVSDSSGLGINGNIETLVQFTRNEAKELVTTLRTIPTDVNLGRLNLNLLPSEITYVAERITLKDFGINIDNKPFFGAEGDISPNKEDILKVFFTQAQIGDVLKSFDINDYDAVLDGEIKITNVLEQPELHIYDFMVRDITILRDTIGTLNVASEWNNNASELKFEALLQKDLKPVGQLDGRLSMKTDSLDVNLDLNRFGLKWIEPFAEGVLTQIDGSISSNLSIKGTLKKPITQGFLGFNDTKLGIDYTNVVYTISDTIRITPDKVGFNNLTLKDEKGNMAKVNASITHKDFKDMKMALDMNLDNFMVLNTMHRTDSLFYGQVFASGKVNIRGDKTKLDVNMQIKNDKNSKLNILLPQTSEAGDYKSVVYINTPVTDSTAVDSVQNKDIPSKPSVMPVKLNVVLDINQSLALGVVIDPVTGDAMDMKGNGTVNFTYDMSKNMMTTYGQFVLVDGNVKFNLQNIKKLDFKIRDGSRLVFIGDPFKTTFDIVAYRRVRADLKTLDYSFEVESSPTRVPVDCELGITGNMNKMDLRYDISLPTANDDFKRKVSSLINTDEQRIKQFAYLIASGSFYSASGSSGANFTDGMWTNLASSTISSGLNSALGGILGDRWEVGTNLESSDGTLNSLDMSVNVSTKFLDDRLRLTTSLGYRTDNSTASDNSVIGDFEAEYDLNSIWMLKAYNHTNDKFYRQAPTTQGVGIAYTKDAPTLKRLFQTFKPRWGNNPEARLRRERRDSIYRADSMRLAQDSVETQRRIRMADSLALPIDSVTPLLMDSIQSLEKMPIRNEEKE